MAYSRLEQLKIRLRQSDVSCEQEDKFLEQRTIQDLQKELRKYQIWIVDRFQRRQTRL